MGEQEMRNRGARLAVLFAAIGFAIAAVLIGRVLDLPHWKDYVFHLLAATFALFTTSAALGRWAGAQVHRGGGLVPCLVVAEASMLASVIAGALMSFLTFPIHGSADSAVEAYLLRPVQAVLVGGTVPALVLGTVYFIALRASSRPTPATPPKAPDESASRR